ncbi:MAG: glutamine--fructose-6-phosphate transaminase (isomerizing) [SAR202 cluster bacterium]|nr:glutamine--fructose-6-phosphate transaminase (isomerizing) [SAR202 cluster bacterium]
MCGIIGYVGAKPVLPVLIEGLRRMEYRGYDSAGVALVGSDGIELRRSAGKLSNLESVLQSDPVTGGFGIGHTRWATHGRPTEENAHPHRDCSGRIVVVHNGIIENYLELKAELQAQGHFFTTQTDTEVVAHLVERETRGDGLLAAVRRALALLQGMFAIVLVSADDQDTIVAARSGPPIVVGLGEGEFFVASDIPAVLSHTRNLVFMDDGEMAVITRSGVAFTDFSGHPVEKSPQRISWDPLMAEKGGHRHFMLKEIHEQPSAVRDTIVGRISQESQRVFLDELNLTPDVLRGIHRVAILACGTSWHAGLLGKYLIETLAGLPVEVDYGSEYRYREPVVLPGTLVVAITQSGETADTLAALREARRKGALGITICNVVGSMATREAQGTLYTHAGPEIGVASTKAFTSQLVALQLLAIFLAQEKGVLGPDALRPHLDALMGLPHLLEDTLKVSGLVEKVAERFANRTDFLFLGRGIHYPIALEGALKLKEISYIHAEGYPAGEMKHGPIALIDEQMPVVAIAPRNHVFEKMLGNVQEAKARGGSVIAVTSKGEQRMAAVLDPQRDVEIQVPDAGDLISPVLTTIPLQLLAYHIAVRRGCDVDQPRNLAKSVTVE